MRVITVMIVGIFVMSIVAGIKAHTNNPPNTPSVPSGPTWVWGDEVNTYSTSATDPDGDMVRYGFDWGMAPPLPGQAMLAQVAPHLHLMNGVHVRKHIIM